MRLMLLSTAMTAALTTAGAALAADAAGSAGGPPAPIFYCPTATATPTHAAAAACPSVTSAGVYRGHASRTRLARHRLRIVRSTITFGNGSPPRTAEDYGTSASQAWAYRYEMERGGLHPWEVEGDRYRDDNQDDNRDYAWRDERGAHDWAQQPPPPREGGPTYQDDSGYGQPPTYAEPPPAPLPPAPPPPRVDTPTYQDDSGYGQQRNYAEHDEQRGQRRERHHHHHERDRDRHDDQDSGYAGGAEEHHFAYEHRERDNTGGSVHGSVDGDRYGYAWGDRDSQRHDQGEYGSIGEGVYGPNDSDSHGYADQHERNDRDAGGYAHHSGGGFSYSEESGSSSSERGYSDGHGWSGGAADGGDRYGPEPQGWTGEPAHATADPGVYHWRYGQGGGYEVYDYAGRDEYGYLVWSGKPRRQ